MGKPTFYTRQEYSRACEEQRVIEANEQRKREETAKLINGRKWP